MDGFALHPGSFSNVHGDGNDNGKNAMGQDKQNNNFAPASRFFVQKFLCRQNTTSTWKCLILRFCGGLEDKTTTFFFFSWTSIHSFTILLQAYSRAFIYYKVFFISLVDTFFLQVGRKFADVTHFPVTYGLFTCI